MLNPNAAPLLALVAVVGFICQWAAWRVKLPAILFLLLSGIILGPILNVIQPDILLGDLLFPVVSLCVAIILFEGSLTLRFDQLKEVSGVIRRLVTLGAVVTWLLTAALSHSLFNFDWPLALLFGSLVVVTGPTVIVPMLRTVRPNAKISNILRWEGILIDPIGALLAVVVYDFMITSGGADVALQHSLLSFVKIIALGIILGLLAGYVLGLMLRHRWLPEYLHNFATIAIVLGVFTLSNAVEHESGLLTVTVMGICLANMRDVQVQNILSFKENLTVLLISGLFILLAARVDLSNVAALGWSALILLLALQLVIRPIAVWLSSTGNGLTWQEKFMISWIGPRGIVAAAVSGLFALQLEQQGYERASDVVSLTFFVIIGTVVLQSTTAGLIARLLGVTEPSPKGVLIIGANLVAREVAKTLQQNDFRVLLADTNYDAVSEARLAGLPVFYGNPISEYADQNLDLIGIGRLMALSHRREDNVLASLRYRHEFGAHNVFALKTRTEASVQENEKKSISQEHKGAYIGDTDLTWSDVAKTLRNGGKFRTTGLTEEYGYNEHLITNQEKGAIPLFAIDNRQHLQVFTSADSLQPSAGWKIISLSAETVTEEAAKAAEQAPEQGSKGEA